MERDGGRRKRGKRKDREDVGGGMMNLMDQSDVNKLLRSVGGDNNQFRVKNLLQYV